MWASSRLFVIVLSATCLAASLSAQEPKGAEEKKKADAVKQVQKQPELPFELQDFWDKDKGVGTAAWAACMGQAPPAGGAWNPWGILGARVLCHHPKFALPDWQFVFEECLPIWQNFLDAIQDNRPLPSVERKELKELRGSDWGMYLALIQAIDRSHTATLDMFKKSAAAYDHVGYAHLRGKPAQYRGKIITIKGTITRVMKHDVPRYVQSDDLLYVYSTNIQGTFKNEPPFAVVFTELPHGVSYKDKIDMEVTFYGYFLGHVRFEGDPKKKEKDVFAPYLVGKTLIVNRTTPPVDSTESYSYNLIVWVVGGIVCILILAVFLNFWFRRADHRIETQLAQVRDKHHPFSLEPAEPEPPLAEPISPPTENGAPPT